LKRDVGKLLRVTGLHRVPFDNELFKANVALYGKDKRLMRPQIQVNWDNAWYVVVSYAGPAEDIDVRKFAHKVYFSGFDSEQAAWREKTISSGPEQSKLAFFLHYVYSYLPLFYGRTRLTLPKATKAPKGLVSQMKYLSPD
jgi:hypothetical protein